MSLQRLIEELNRTIRPVFDPEVSKQQAIEIEKLYGKQKFKVNTSADNIIEVRSDFEIALAYHTVKKYFSFYLFHEKLTGRGGGIYRFDIHNPKELKQKIYDFLFLDDYYSDIEDIYFYFTPEKDFTNRTTDENGDWLIGIIGYFHVFAKVPPILGKIVKSYQRPPYFALEVEEITDELIYCVDSWRGLYFHTVGKYGEITTKNYKDAEIPIKIKEKYYWLKEYKW